MQRLTVQDGAETLQIVQRRCVLALEVGKVEPVALNQDRLDNQMSTVNLYNLDPISPKDPSRPRMRLRTPHVPDHASVQPRLR